MAKAASVDYQLLETLTTYLSKGNLVVANNYSIEIRYEQIKCLQDGVWLNSEVIGFWFEWWCRGMGAGFLKNMPRTTNPRCWMANTFFYAKMMGHTGVYSYDNIKKWTRSLDILSLDKVIIPINADNTHWYLAVIDFRTRQTHVLDSMGTRRPRTHEILRRWLKDEYRERRGGEELDLRTWTTLTNAAGKAPRQDNGCDCGVFMCLFAACASLDRPFLFGPDDIRMIRAWMVKIIYKSGEADGQVRPNLCAVGGEDHFYDPLLEHIGDESGSSGQPQVLYDHMEGSDGDISVGGSSSSSIEEVEDHHDGDEEEKDYDPTEKKKALHLFKLTKAAMRFSHIAAKSLLAQKGSSSSADDDDRARIQKAADSAAAVHASFLSMMNDHSLIADRALKDEETEHDAKWQVFNAERDNAAYHNKESREFDAEHCAMLAANKLQWVIIPGAERFEDYPPFIRRMVHMSPSFSNALKIYERIHDPSAADDPARIDMYKRALHRILDLAEDDRRVAKCKNGLVGYAQDVRSILLSSSDGAAGDRSSMLANFGFIWIPKGAKCFGTLGGNNNNNDDANDYPIDLLQMMRERTPSFALASYLYAQYVSARKLSEMRTSDQEKASADKKADSYYDAAQTIASIETSQRNILLELGDVHWHGDV